jgi:hypothetical protein
MSTQVELVHYFRLTYCFNLDYKNQTEEKSVCKIRIRVFFKSKFWTKIVLS